MKTLVSFFLYKNSTLYQEKKTYKKTSAYSHYAKKNKTGFFFLRI